MIWKNLYLTQLPVRKLHESLGIIEIKMHIPCTLFFFGFNLLCLLNKVNSKHRNEIRYTNEPVTTFLTFPDKHICNGLC